MRFTDEQHEAIERRDGPLFLEAGAGSGKTRGLVERFVRAVCERGLDVEAVLVITYTERAAGELRARIRERLAESHVLTYDFPFVWENWRRRTDD